MSRHKPRGGPKAPKETPLSKRQVFFAVLNERAIQHEAIDAREDLGEVARIMGAERIRSAYSRVDVARNRISKKFMELTKNPKDTVVMLDTDHTHPMDIVYRLARHDVGVVGALCFRRGEPYDPQFYVRGEDGELRQPVEWDPEALDKGAIVGSGAIAIQRWVFEALEAKGFHYPWFRNMYTDGVDEFYGEDWYFGLNCEKAGIPHHCDFSTVSPHMRTGYVDEKTWNTYKAMNPSILGGDSEAKEAQATLGESGNRVGDQEVAGDNEARPESGLASD